MEIVSCRCYHLASTAINPDGLGAYLQDIGAPDWTTNATSDGEKLIEVAGKGCYRSFTADLNKNLTKVRTNRNAEYIQDGIIKVAHGSVLEHVHDTFALVGVSRILTHEMVRHRIANYSQESLRFVRLDHLKAYYPDVFRSAFLDRVSTHLAEKTGTAYDPDVQLRVKQLFDETFEHLEDVQLELANLLRLDELESFNDKKKLTSAMRRLAPEGLATAIIMTTNLRQWRLIIQKRTAGPAEEEIRKATGLIAELLIKKYPAVFADVETEEIDGVTAYNFRHGCG
jgi:thymidylate synthase (FAD)